jgi:UDP-N-acetylglucosamine acyltransferase
MPIHPAAIIDKQAYVPSSADIGPHVVIEGPVKLGENVKVYANAYLAGWTEIGDRCEIHPGAVVGHLPQDFHFGGARSYCKIGAGTIVREFASIHRGTQPESWTIVGEDCFILGYAHIGHNCELADGVKLYNCAALSGHVIVGENAIISGYCLVHQFARIGEYVMVGGGARVTKDVPPYMKVLHESQCVGYNAIGLRRSGRFTTEEINEVREAYKTLFHSGRPFRPAVEEFAARAHTRAGRRILGFLRSESKLGFVGGRKSVTFVDQEGE